MHYLHFWSYHFGATIFFALFRTLVSFSPFKIRNTSSFAREPPPTSFLQFVLLLLVLLGLVADAAFWWCCCCCCVQLLLVNVVCCIWCTLCILGIQPNDDDDDDDDAGRWGCGAAVYGCAVPRCIFLWAQRTPCVCVCISQILCIVV